MFYNVIKKYLGGVFMDLTMDIASMAMSMQQASLQNSISTSLLAKTMDSQQQQINTLLQGFNNANPLPPVGSVGHCFDVRA